ncbi:MAG: glycosyltransferase family 2 protein [Chryseolinea sp.]
MKDLSASIVLYKNSARVLAHAIHSFLSATVESRLFIIDNSPTDELKYFSSHPRITYILNGNNVGFGAGHNIAIKQIIATTKYHLVLNPDVYFDKDVIAKCYQFMQDEPEIGLVMPKVLYPDGRLQPLCKLLPSPRTLIMRRFLWLSAATLKKLNYTYELHCTGYKDIVDVPFLSGCFMFLRTSTLQQVGLFDERFFLYTEDVDLSRRIHKVARTVFYPLATIYHHHERGSYKKVSLLIHNINSAIRYFNKWGWTTDKERIDINARTLNRLVANQQRMSCIGA